MTKPLQKQRQSELECAGSARAAFGYRFLMGDKTLPREVLPLLAETREQPQEEREREKKELEKALKVLSERIKPSPGPEVPDHLWKEAAACERKEWPLLNDEENAALEEVSDDDLRPEEMILTMGEYLSTSLSTPELENWIEVIYKDKKFSVNKSRAQLLAELTCYIIDIASVWTSYYTLAHVGGLLMRLTKGELKNAAESYGLEGTGNKADIAARLVEYFFDDELVPV